MCHCICTRPLCNLDLKLVYFRFKISCRDGSEGPSINSFEFCSGTLRRPGKFSFQIDMVASRRLVPRTEDPSSVGAGALRWTEGTWWRNGRNGSAQWTEGTWWNPKRNGAVSRTITESQHRPMRREPKDGAIAYARGHNATPI